MDEPEYMECGLIYVGDEVREVNGVPVKGKSRPDVLQVLQVRDGPIVLTLVPFTHRNDVTHMRAHFTTDPAKDPEIPCGDVGLAFSRGDVLVVVNREDRLWWLAYKEGEPPAKTGLIPSPGLQQRRIASNLETCPICIELLSTNVHAYNQCPLRLSYEITTTLGTYVTLLEVAEDLNISIGLCHPIFINDLGMRRVAAKFVPKLLNCDQKQHRMNIANEMLDSVRDDPNLLQRVITGDEAWVYGYDVETKAQSSQWKLPHEPRPKKTRQVRSNVKVLLTVFFDCRGVVHHEFLPQGRKLNKEYYLQVMRNLREAIRQKRPDLWKNKNWLLHHDNAPAHTSLLVRDFLAKNNTLMMPQPPYSPDLAPCDFFLFPKLKMPMKGRRYSTLDEIKTTSKEELKKIFKNLLLLSYLHSISL
ncbi:hypothetical protein LAZ67_12003104 [Cordylochernes scorpioides]|uniref:SH3 domain-containing protein n=1 Tax=Cordylochernes scorpioides TaxID=51811 RepID=A0ABY6L5Q5_9ARAC|nr:hypothetical protein LAZ67_12003104 [Cordylochernes scorpioides]